MKLGPSVRGIRIALGGLLAAASLAVAAAPAGANGAFSVHYRAPWAGAVFELGGAANTIVTISGQQPATQYPRGRPEVSQGVWVEASQSFCDATDETVDRMWYGGADTTVNIDRALRTASWAPVEVALTGDEVRYPGCGDDTDWEHPVFTDISSAVTVDAGFRATGPLVNDDTVYRESYPPLRFVTVVLERSRSAAVVATLSSDDPLLSFGTLDDPVAAKIAKANRIELTVGGCPFDPPDTWPHCPAG